MKIKRLNPRITVALLYLASAYCFAQSSIDDRLGVSFGAYVTDLEVANRSMVSNPKVSAMLPTSPDPQKIAKVGAG